MPRRAGPKVVGNRFSGRLGFQNETLPIGGIRHECALHRLRGTDKVWTVERPIRAKQHTKADDATLRNAIELLGWASQCIVGDVVQTRRILRGSEGLLWRRHLARFLWFKQFARVWRDAYATFGKRNPFKGPPLATANRGTEPFDVPGIVHRGDVRPVRFS